MSIKFNIVELGDFGSFWLKTTLEGIESPEEVRPARLSACYAPRRAMHPGKVRRAEPGKSLTAR